MPKLNITGEERKSKELPDSFHDPDMSEEEYEKRKPIINPPNEFCLTSQFINYLL